MLTVAALLGADGVRVGFEDNVYLRKGQLAASNAELVADIAAVAQALGRRVATPGEARARLGLPTR
jgi:3-keto-5-aminohexanoate cleavage enzyme